MDDFLQLNMQQRGEIIAAGSVKLGKAPVILEKDVWVCWALRTLFSMPDRNEMAFKGGTSLSKVYGAIQRFSEDLDVTLDFRSWGESLEDLEKLSNSKRKQRFEAYKFEVQKYVHEAIKPYFEKELHACVGKNGIIEVSEDGEQLFVHYPSALEGSEGYIADRIFIEFGGRNITDPKTAERVIPYLAEAVEGLALPVAEVDVLSPQRTYWEKATLIHVACHKEWKSDPERLSRHWYDLMKLSENEIGECALNDMPLLLDVLRYKKMFFNAGYANYGKCIDGAFVLVPQEPLLSAVRKDYKKMVAAHMFEKAPPSFERIIEVLTTVERRINESVMKD